jgi:anti-sigma factor RsiW
MANEDLEFLISQHADGMLDPARADEIERLIASDADARAIWLEHRRVNQLVRAAPDLPRLDWDRVAGMISSHIDQAESAERERVIRLPVGRWAAVGHWSVRVAAVAALLLVGIFIRQAGRTTPTGGLSAPVLARVIEVQVPAATEVAVAPINRVLQVSIVPAPADVPTGRFEAVAFDPWEASDVRIVVAAGPQRSRADPFDGFGY